MTETQQRFLKQIAERLGAERVVELYLFPPIRQGGMESGVAVLAIDEPSAATALPTVDVPPDGDAAPDEAAADDADVVAVDIATDLHAPDVEIEVPTAAEPVEGEVVMAADAAPVAVAPTATRRHAIYTARYRYTFKGPERGKWESDVNVEADAPLEAVEAVVRGVQRRAGEFADAERMTAENFRAALDAPVWAVER
jgi:hypothetical protein